MHVDKSTALPPRLQSYGNVAATAELRSVTSWTGEHGMRQKQACVWANPRRYRRGYRALEM